MSGFFTVPQSQRTFAGMYAMVEKSFQDYSGPFVCGVQCVDEYYNHESDVKNDMTFKITDNKTEHSSELLLDILWGTRRGNHKLAGTYGSMCVWKEGRGQCYFAVSECSQMRERMMHVWHFPFIDDERVYGDCVVFVRV
jgi:hypothetical protein